jgi:diadenylate cyclase
VFDIRWLSQRLNWWSIPDILLVALTFYWLLHLIRGTQAIQVLRGTVIIALAMIFAASLLPFRAFSWLVEKTLPALLVAIPVIFQPELRRALERVGRTGAYLAGSTRESSTVEVIEQVCVACTLLSDRHHGALIVLERSTGLEEYIETGVPVDSRVTADLLVTIFFPNTALHDGAVVIRNGRIVAAACVLPLPSGTLSDRPMGLRHRASIGVTEDTDAVAIVVSEETGIISVAHNGRMIRRLDGKRLRSYLKALYPAPRPPSLSGLVQDVRDRVENVLGNSKP